MEYPGVRCFSRALPGRLQAVKKSVACRESEHLPVQGMGSTPRCALRPGYALFVFAGLFQNLMSAGAIPVCGRPARSTRRATMSSMYMHAYDGCARTYCFVAASLDRIAVRAG